MPQHMREQGRLRQKGASIPRENTDERAELLFSSMFLPCSIRYQTAKPLVACFCSSLYKSQLATMDLILARKYETSRLFSTAPGKWRGNRRMI